MRRFGPLFVCLLLVVSGTAFSAVTGGDTGVDASDATATTDGPAQIEQDEPDDWREYDPDDDLNIDESDGLSDEELEAVITRAMVRVEEIREVEFEERPPITVMTREEFQTEYAGLVSNSTENQTAFENAQTKALFLVGDDEDVTEVRQENQNVSVGGFYTPSTGEIVVVTDGNEVPDGSVLAHELYHAYQDREWGLQEYDERTYDGSNAQNGLIEGDAAYVEHRYRQQCESGEWECVGVGSAGAPGESDADEEEPANFGLLLLEFQPYNDGPTFVQHVYERGGWEAVNDLYDDPPRTAQQVISPEKYPDDEPREVTIDDTQSAEWDRIRPEERPDHGVMGMSAISSMFVLPLYDSDGRTQIVPHEEWFDYDESGELPDIGFLNYDTSYATGWDGDRFHAYENDEGDLAYTWRVAWESSDDAETFVDGFDDLVDYWGGERVAGDTYAVEDGGFAGAYHVTIEDDTVTIVHAPTEGTLADVHADAEPSDDELPTEDEDDDQPGFGVVVALAALVLAAFALAIGRDR